MKKLLSLMLCIVFKLQIYPFKKLTIVIKAKKAPNSFLQIFLFSNNIQLDRRQSHKSMKKFIQSKRIPVISYPPKNPQAFSSRILY